MDLKTNSIITFHLTKARQDSQNAQKRLDLAKAILTDYQQAASLLKDTREPMSKSTGGEKKPGPAKESPAPSEKKPGQLKRPENPLDNATIEAGLNPKNERIQALVAYLGRHDIKLVNKESSFWELVEPKHTDVVITVSIRSFPPSASEEQMRWALHRINLAYNLNAPARLAMSDFGFQGSKQGGTKEVNALELRMVRLFHDYNPAKDIEKKRLSKIDVSKTKLTFDPKTCSEGKGEFGWGLGSVHVTVLGHEDGKCVFDYRWEVEGAGNYQVHRVKVPTDSGLVVIEADRERGTKKNHWSVVFTSFTQEQTLLVRKARFGWFEDLVDGTEEFAAQRRSAQGKGAAPTKGHKATLRFAVYGDAKFDRLADGAKQRQTVELTLGAGKAWKWVELAAAEMTVGERRQVKLPVKIAEGAKDWLPGLKPEAMIYLEMELLDARPTPMSPGKKTTTLQEDQKSLLGVWLQPQPLPKSSIELRFFRDHVGVTFLSSVDGVPAFMEYQPHPFELKELEGKRVIVLKRAKGGVITIGPDHDKKYRIGLNYRPLMGDTDGAMPSVVHGDWVLWRAGGPEGNSTKDYVAAWDRVVAACREYAGAAKKPN